jgi:hypothetical protein
LDPEITYNGLKKIALEEFPDITISTSISRGPFNIAKSLRIFFIDDSFLEIWISANKYSYHWQKTNGKIYRYDNAPHKKYQKIATFPKHFHEDKTVKESYLNDDPCKAIKEVLQFIRINLK